MEKKTGKNNDCVNPSSPVLASICLEVDVSIDQSTTHGVCLVLMVFRTHLHHTQQWRLTLALQRKKQRPRSA